MVENVEIRVSDSSDTQFYTHNPGSFLDERLTTAVTVLLPDTRNLRLCKYPLKVDFGALCNCNMELNHHFEPIRILTDIFTSIFPD